MQCLQVLRGGRERSLGSYLARADTPHRLPDEPAAVVVGRQATLVVVQVVLHAATVRGSRPPAAVGAGKEERAIVVEATIDRRESGAVTGNTFKLVKGW